MSVIDDKISYSLYHILKHWTFGTFHANTHWTLSYDQLVPNYPMSPRHTKHIEKIFGEYFLQYRIWDMSPNICCTYRITCRSDLEVKGGEVVRRFACALRRVESLDDSIESIWS